MIKKTVARYEKMTYLAEAAVLFMHRMFRFFFFRHLVEINRIRFPKISRLISHFALAWSNLIYLITLVRLTSMSDKAQAIRINLTSNANGQVFAQLVAARIKSP